VGAGIDALADARSRCAQPLLPLLFNPAGPAGRGGAEPCCAVKAAARSALPSPMTGSVPPFATDSPPTPTLEAPLLSAAGSRRNVGAEALVRTGAVPTPALAAALSTA